MHFIVQLQVSLNFTPVRDRNEQRRLYSSLLSRVPPSFKSHANETPISVVERFSIESRKTKTEPITRQLLFSQSQTVVKPNPKPNQSLANSVRMQPISNRGKTKTKTKTKVIARFLSTLN